MNHKYAGFWIRVLANILDSFIMLPILFGIDVLLFKLLNPLDMTYFEYMLSPETASTPWNAYDTTTIIASMTIGILYFGLLTSKKQATLGKMVVGVKVIGQDGEAISFGRAIGRYFSYILSSILYIGYIMVAFSEKKQGLHDKICKTYVVYK